MAKKHEYVGSVCVTVSDYYGNILIEIDDGEAGASCRLNPDEARILASKLQEVADIAEKAPMAVNIVETFTTSKRD